MGKMCRLDRKIKNTRSRERESAEISEMKMKIASNLNSVHDEIAEIGLFYWNLYAEGGFAPSGDAVPLFEAIRGKLAENEDLDVRMEYRRAAGEQERRNIEDELSRREELGAERAGSRKASKRKRSSLRRAALDAIRPASAPPEMFQQQ